MSENYNKSYIFGELCFSAIVIILVIFGFKDCQDQRDKEMQCVNATKDPGNCRLLFIHDR